MARLPGSFYARDTMSVARALLGQIVVRALAGQRLSGVLAEGFYYSQTFAAEVDPNGRVAGR